MNTVKQILGTLFEYPVQNMSIPAYMSYMDKQGKVTARTLMDLCAAIFTILEEQEKTNVLNEANFKDVEGILDKMINKDVVSVGSVVVTNEPTHPQTSVSGTNFTCDVCGKVLSTKLALSGHKSSHK